MNPSVPDISSITSVLPAKYAAYAALIVAVTPLMTRAYYALVNNGGLSGIFRAIFYGTNTPKIIVAGACILLSSCATTAAFLSSPFGQATIQTADQLAKQVLVTTETLGLQQIIIQASAKLAGLKAQGPDQDVAKEALRIGQIAGYAGVIEAAQVKYAQLTGARYTMPKNPVKVTP